MLPTVAVFTDTYLPTVNGVSYTIQTWRDRWVDRGGRMHVVYPEADGHDPVPDEHPVTAFEFPFYEGFHLGLPETPPDVGAADLVHAHTPFLLGLAGMRFARAAEVPLVASYHTPTAEYADYLTGGPLADGVEWAARAYERWYLNRTDAVVVPSEPARAHLGEIGIETPVYVVPNGVDVERFAPVDAAAFRERHDLPDGPLVGYTGRHGYEKRVGDVLDAATHLGDVTVVFGGDGPARADLEAKAERLGVDARFLGFLDREELPAFYSALDVFAFPSPVETQGLVALEANACGTPVVGADSGALSETIDDGETGFHFPAGDAASFARAIERALDEQDRLRETCLARRDGLSVEHAVDRLSEVFDAVGRVSGG
jgi:glycosyltransferase involved in cell wall biosynthesis